MWGVLPFHGIIALGKTLTRHWFAISACSCPLQFAEETHLNGPRVNLNLFWFSILCVVFRWFKMAYPSRVSFHFGARIWRDRAASWSGQRFTVYVPDLRGRAVWERIQIRPCRGCILHPPVLVSSIVGAKMTYLPNSPSNMSVFLDIWGKIFVNKSKIVIFVIYMFSSLYFISAVYLNCNGFYWLDE